MFDHYIDPRLTTDRWCIACKKEATHCECDDEPTFEEDDDE